MNVSAIGRNFSAPINQSIQQTPNALLANHSYNNYNNSNTSEKTNNVNNQPSFGDSIWSRCVRVVSGIFRLGDGEAARLKNSPNLDGAYFFMDEKLKRAYNRAASLHKAATGEEVASSAKKMSDDDWLLLNM